MKNRIILIISIIAIFLGSYFFMNRNYDRLARYPYNDERVKTALETQLNSRQLAYIVDYSVAPEEYMRFIYSPNFNVYHIEDYNKVDKHFFKANPNNIVRITEALLKHTKDYENFLNENSWRFVDDLCDEIERYYK